MTEVLKLVLEVRGCEERKMETLAEKVDRLKREIAERNAELAHLVLGDPTRSVSIHAGRFQEGACDHTQYSFEKHGRRCTCGALMVDFGD